ncbi:hypothetical protein ACK33T_19705, partial [Aeromonas veronii]
QKAPSVALTLGWERHDFLADLGNNARNSISNLEERGYLQRITKYDAGANKKTRILILNLDKLTPVSAEPEAKGDAWEDDLDDW